MNSIVVGIDGSETSVVALDWAAARAVPGQTRVEIVMIAGSLFSADARMDASVAQAEQRLRTLAPGVEVAARRFVGRMPDSLLEHACAADLVVVGSHRGRRLRSILTGRQPIQICARSRVPIVVVPGDWSGKPGPVVVGLDSNDPWRVAVRLAADEADAAGVALAIVHAWEMPAAPLVVGSVAVLASPMLAEDESRAILAQVALDLALTHPDLVVEQVLIQQTQAAALIQASKKASLLVMGTSHRPAFPGTPLGPEGRDVLLQSSVPVCVVPVESG